MRANPKFKKKSTEDLRKSRDEYLDAVSALEDEIEFRENLYATTIGKQLVKKLGKLIPEDSNDAVRVVNHIARVYIAYLEDTQSKPQLVENSGLTKEEENEMMEEDMTSPV